MPPSSRSAIASIPPFLTAFALALAFVLALAYPWRLVMLYLATLPVPLALLWASRNVPSPAERIAFVDDAAHASAP